MKPAVGTLKAVTRRRNHNRVCMSRVTSHFHLTNQTAPTRSPHTHTHTHTHPHALHTHTHTHTTHTQTHAPALTTITQTLQRNTYMQPPHTPLPTLPHSSVSPH